eukprot:6210489-Pleurochrysis_carterae.AAC.2
MNCDLSMHCEVSLHAYKSAEVPVSGRDTGRTIFEFPESVPARAAASHSPRTRRWPLHLQSMH